MGQLVMCIDAKGQHGTLVERKIYTSRFTSSCACQRWMYIEEAEIPVPPVGGKWFCATCNTPVSNHGEDGRHVFRACRFIPLNDPDLKEEPESYEEMDLERRRLLALGGNIAKTMEELHRKINSGRLIMKPSNRELLEELKRYWYRR